MDAKNDGPRARDAGPHQIQHSQKRAPVTTRNQPPAQQPSAARPARSCIAELILHEALALDIHVGTDGSDLVMLAPLKVPRDVRRAFEAALEEFRAEVIDAIQRDNAARTGKLVPEAIDAEGNVS
jgi:hypothetical protein